MKRIAPLLRGRRIKRIVHLRKDIVHPQDADLEKYLTGRRVENIIRRGKRIVIPGLRNKVMMQSLRVSPRSVVTAVVRRLQERA